ncbi:MAG: LysM peptidoglycan-binding domain-containing protein [Streptococcaceae bacterium]|jgi:cytoskeletal protein RodZ|nr:LysM peptidoglycan-binding domain-containing protein [Streptococcaceae bacterium]
MARKGKNKKTTQEPWEKSIYETEYEPTQSRSAQRKVKKGNALFMKILVFLILVIVCVPAGAYFYIQSTRHNNNNNAATTTTTTSTTTEAPYTQEPSQTSETTTNDTQTTDTTATTDQTQETTNDTTNLGQEFTEVLPGEGISLIANRTGVPVETIASLNPTLWTATGDWQPGAAINPGDKIRIK